MLSSVLLEVNTVKSIVWIVKAMTLGNDITNEIYRARDAAKRHAFKYFHCMLADGNVDESEP